MSRSNQVDLVNPAQKFIRWNGESGGLKYFDKTKGEKGENVDIKIPFKFIVLDTLATVKGFNDSEKSGYWSNEVRKTATDTLTVRSKGGLCAAGLYKEVVKDPNCKGAKFCASVYVAINEGGELKIANMQFVGASLSAWIEFTKKNNVNKIAIDLASMVEGKKGKTVFQIPIFKAIKVSPEMEEKAIALDKELQTYLEAYLKVNKEKANGEAFVEGLEEEDKPEAVKAEVKQEAAPVKTIAQANEDDIFSETDTDLPF